VVAAVLWSPTDDGGSPGWTTRHWSKVTRGAAAVVPIGPRWRWSRCQPRSWSPSPAARRRRRADTTATSPGPTRCARRPSTIDAVVEDLGIAPSDDEGRAAGRKVLALGRAELVRLRALEAPAKDAAKVSAIYREIERGWDRVERRPRALFDEPARSPRRRSRGRLRARGVRPRLKHRSGHV
jgi:hypothetical protein